MIEGRVHTASIAMGKFSDDGQWWWDGTTWVATAQVVLPQLPPTEFEQSGKLETARSRLRKRGWLNWAHDFSLVGLTAAVLFVPAERALRDYRLWTLEQLALATAYLLGPNEPMLAAEATVMPPEYVGDSSKRGLAVVLTAAHVLLLRIDSLDGQPRWIALAARPTDVKMKVRPFLQRLFRGPALVVSRGNEQWIIRGEIGVFQPKPVVDAWRQAADGTVLTR
jgi:hypothetical protein